MNKLENPIVNLTRDCMVDGRPGYFHMWEQFSKPVSASPLMGGPPAGVIAQVFGIVEFSDGIERVDPYKIKFTDEENLDLYAFELKLKKEDRIMEGKNGRKRK